MHDASVLAQLAQAIHLLRRIARGAGNECSARALDIGDNGVKGHDVREVDDHIGRRCVLELGQIKADLGHDIKDGLSGGIDNALGGGADERAHTARSHNDGLNQADQLPSGHR